MAKERKDPPDGGGASGKTFSLPDRPFTTPNSSFLPAARRPDRSGERVSSDPRRAQRLVSVSTRRQALRSDDVAVPIDWTALDHIMQHPPISHFVDAKDELHREEERMVLDKVNRDTRSALRQMRVMVRALRDVALLATSEDLHPLRRGLVRDLAKKLCAGMSLVIGGAALSGSQMRRLNSLYAEAVGPAKEDDKRS